jgi:hypothetical protein
MSFPDVVPTRVKRLAFALAALALAGGCEVQECDNEETGADGVCLKSLKRFEGDSRSQSADYPTGTDLVILSPNGDITVDESGDPDTLEVTFEPFILRAFDTPREEAEQEMDELEMTLTQSGRGMVIDVDRPSGSPGTLGADIRVGLPWRFAAVLDVDQQNGSTDVRFLADAFGLIATSDNGSCDVVTGIAEHVSVRCENGDLRATIESIPPFLDGNGFQTGNGSIHLRLPVDGVYSVSAEAIAGGTVVVEDLPSNCSVAEASAAAKTVSCNGATSEDPVYWATADGTGLADVVLEF